MGGIPGWLPQLLGSYPRAHGHWSSAGTVSVTWFSWFFFFSLSGDEEDELFKGATLKVPKSKAQSEEEDEDEVVRRSHTMPRPHTTTRGLFPTGSEKRSGVCWWPASWALSAGPCGSGLGAGRGKLCKHNGDGQVPLYSWTRTTVCLHAGMVCTVSEEGWAD